MVKDENIFNFISTILNVYFRIEGVLVKEKCNISDQLAEVRGLIDSAHNPLHLDYWRSIS